MIELCSYLQTSDMAFFGGQAADGMRAQRLAKERELEKGEQEFQKKKLAGLCKRNYPPVLNNKVCRAPPLLWYYLTTLVVVALKITF